MLRCANELAEFLLSRRSSYADHLQRLRARRDGHARLDDISMIAQGEPLAAIVSTVTVASVFVYNDLVSRVSAENRDAAGRFIIWWYAGFNAEIVTIGLEVGARG